MVTGATISKKIIFHVLFVIAYAALLYMQHPESHEIEIVSKTLKCSKEQRVNSNYGDCSELRQPIKIGSNNDLITLVHVSPSNNLFSDGQLILNTKLIYENKQLKGPFTVKLTLNITTLYRKRTSNDSPWQNYQPSKQIQQNYTLECSFNYSSTNLDCSPIYLVELNDLNQYEYLVFVSAPYNVKQQMNVGLEALELEGKTIYSNNKFTQFVIDFNLIFCFTLILLWLCLKPSITNNSWMLLFPLVILLNFPLEYYLSLLIEVKYLLIFRDFIKGISHNIFFFFTLTLFKPTNVIKLSKDNIIAILFFFLVKFLFTINNLSERIQIIFNPYVWFWCTQWGRISSLLHQGFEIVSFFVLCFVIFVEILKLNKSFKQSKDILNLIDEGFIIFISFFGGLLTVITEFVTIYEKQSFEYNWLSYLDMYNNSFWTLVMCYFFILRRC